MATRTRDADVVVASPYFDGRAFTYIRTSDNVPERLSVAVDFDTTLCPVKLFNEVARFWIACYNPATGIARGVCEMMGRGGPHREFGDFSMEEVITAKGPAGMVIERDLYYTPVTIRHALKHGDED